MTKKELSNLVTSIITFAESNNVKEQLFNALLSEYTEKHSEELPMQETVSQNSKKADTKKAVSNSGPKPVPVPAKREYGLPKFVQNKKYVTYTNDDGSYLKHSAMRQVLNSRIKELGGVYDKDAKAWAFKTQKLAKSCVETIDRVVTKSQIEEVAKNWKPTK